MKKNGNKFGVWNCLVVSVLVLTMIYLEKSLLKAVVIAIELSAIVNMVLPYFVFKRILLGRFSISIGFMSAMSFIPIWSLAYPFWYARPNLFYVMMVVIVTAYCGCISRVYLHYSQ